MKRITRNRLLSKREAAKYNKVRDKVTADFPVKPLSQNDKAEDRATCGHCGRSWDDGKVTSMTPAPSGRCPFESFHEYSDELKGE